MVVQSTFWNKREVSLRMAAKEKDYVIVPSTYDPGFEGPFWMVRPGNLPSAPHALTNWPLARSLFPALHRLRRLSCTRLQTK